MCVCVCVREGQLHEKLIKMFTGAQNQHRNPTKSDSTNKYEEKTEQKRKQNKSNKKSSNLNTATEIVFKYLKRQTRS